MDEEEESLGLYRPQPVEYSNQEEEEEEGEKFPGAELSNAQQFEVVPEMDESHLVGSPKTVDGIDDSQLVGNPQVVADMDDSLGGRPKTVDGIDDSQLVGNPLVVADMDDSKLVGNPPVVAGMDGSQLVGSPNVVSGTEDSQLARNPSVVAGVNDSQLVGNPTVDADMNDSQLIGDPNVVAGTDYSQLVGNPPVVAYMDDSQLVGGTNVVAGMDDGQLVGNSPVVADMDGAQLVGDSANMDDSGEAVEMDDSPVVGGSPIVPDMDDSELVGGSPVVDDPSMVGDEATHLEEVVDMEEEMEVAEETTRGGRKRKRGRAAAKAPVKAIPRKKIEEDVCFICFDGGNLVLCDRRGCPKAYHPACVNRDEAFFRSKGRWNCGWHICSNCEKTAQYMCYTCTYSLCKSCIKKADFSCVRGNKGFCQTCMKTIMLVEKNEQENKEAAQVDFDDKNCWEYLFKDYWIDLKGKLSLTLDELTQARNPSKGSGVFARKEESSVEYNVNNDQGSNADSGSEHVEVSSPKRRRPKRKSKPSTKEEVSSSAAITAGSDGVSIAGDTEWASKELLEFVAHMKNGDTSILSQFDVQALLLDYIKQNDRRDPRRKSQIVCDSRLQNLFGKVRVGHFEMLKLLESHFLLKEDAHTDDQEGNADTEAGQLDAEGSSEVSTKAGTDKRRKSRKKAERGLQRNIDDYAAIDVHNINLIYLKRNLMEDLLEDMDTFQDKVVGSFVRIRITGAGQRQDMYRLVQVVGIGKAKEPYETGKRKTDVMLEILNLNKTEVETIDRISSQDFSEDECKRLRQSIKCGLISRLTVGDIQEKAMALQAARVNDCLEADKLRLGHLRDRASEKGRRKELRECVEKLQRLNTPEERLRRLQEIPEVHTDPKMDPSYESEEEEAEPDDKRRDNYVQPRDAGFIRNGREPISPGKGGSSASDTWSGSRKSSNTTWEQSINTPTRGTLDKRGGIEGTNESTWNEGRDTHQSSSYEKSRSQAQSSGLGSDSWTGQAVVKSEPSSQTTPTSLPTVAATSSSVSEAEKIWHYKDPSGKIQGPFSMVQLRKWSTTGYFPSNLRIWRAMEKQEDSIHLTDALNGKFQKEVPHWDNNFSQPQKGTSGSDNTREGNLNGNSLLQIVKPAETSYHGERIDFQNPPTPTPGTSGGSWRNVGWVGQSPNPGVVNGVQQSLNGLVEDAAVWGGHSPTPAVGERDSGAVSASISPPDSVKPSDGVYRMGLTIDPQNGNSHGANSLAVNNSSMDIQGFVQCLPAPANPSMSNWSSSGNGYNNKIPDSAHQIPNTVDPRRGILTSQGGPPSQQQELHGHSPTVPAQAGNYPNPGFSVSNSVQPPFANWSPTPNTQSVNPWGTTPNMQPSPVPPSLNMQHPPPMTGGPQMQLPPVAVVPHMQPAPVTVGQHMQQPLVAANQSWQPPQGNANMGWGGPASIQANMNMAAWSTPPPPPPPQPQVSHTGTMQQWGNNTTTSWGPPAVNMGSQQKNDGNRYSGHRDRGGFHGGGGDSNHGGGGGGGGRQSWNRQSSFRGGGGSGGGGSSRTPHKGQRVCKYYDSGNCRSGADCDYIHPS